jgi:hypothetical protein
MIRIILPVATLLAWTPPLAAQDAAFEDRVAAALVAAEHAAEVATRQIGAPVSPDQLPVSASGPEIDRALLEAVAARLGTPLRSASEMITCEQAPVFGRCTSNDGSTRAGLILHRIEMTGSGATVWMEAWYLYPSGRGPRMGGRGDRLYLTRSGSGWEIERWEIMVHR